MTRINLNCVFMLAGICIQVSLGMHQSHQSEDLLVLRQNQEKQALEKHLAEQIQEHKAYIKQYEADLKKHVEEEKRRKEREAEELEAYLERYEADLKKHVEEE